MISDEPEDLEFAVIANFNKEKHHFENLIDNIVSLFKRTLYCFFYCKILRPTHWLIYHSFTKYLSISERFWIWILFIKVDTDNMLSKFVLFKWWYLWSNKLECIVDWTNISDFWIVMFYWLENSEEFWKNYLFQSFFLSDIFFSSSKSVKKNRLLFLLKLPITVSLKPLHQLQKITRHLLDDKVSED